LTTKLTQPLSDATGHFPRPPPAKTLPADARPCPRKGIPSKLAPLLFSGALRACAT